jgi:hypothetical protein
MPDAFKIGVRVRLTLGHRHPQFRAGDTGMIAAVMPSAASDGEALYQVRIDGAADALYPMFYAGELEELAE